MKPVIYRNHMLIPADPRISVLIPHAKKLIHEGKEVYLVPHQLDESKVLKNLGYEVTPPMLTNYDWRGTTPFDAQRVTAALVSTNDQSFVLNDLGTGKTRAALFAFDYMRRVEQRIDTLVVTAPLSTLRQTWGREIMTLMPELRYQILHGTRAQRIARLQEPAEVLIINHDGLETILTEMCAALAGRRVMVVFDELTAYKERKTDRWKAANHLARKCQVVVGMTGTPIPNGPLDAYAQMKLVRPAAVKESYGDYRDLTCHKITVHKYVPRADALERVFQKMQPSVRFTRDECFDLPECQHLTMEAPLSSEQADLYQRVARDAAAFCAAGNVKAVNAADQLNKLLQVSLGTVYTTEQEVRVLDCRPRLAVLEQAVAMSASKVIVFSPYKATLKMIATHLEQMYDVAVVSGDTPSAKREQIFTAFMHSRSPQVIVAHPQCMSHGLTLTAASTIVWYGPPASLETYEQANGRITRPGQKHSQLIINIAGTRVEERTYKRLQTKADLQSILLEMYEAQELGETL